MSSFCKGFKTRTIERVVTFYLKHQEEGPVYTVKHFSIEGRNESTIYRIIKRYKETLTIKKKPGAGRPASVMTKIKLQRLYRLANHSDRHTYSSLARHFKCDGKLIKYWLMKRNIRQYKKKKSQLYPETQKEMVRRQCAWLYRYYRNHEFIIDDEKYFTLSHTSNNTYFSSPTKSNNSNDIRHKFKQKFEPKVILRIAISSKGFSQSYIRVNKKGFSINQNNYLIECLTKRLLPFINEYHSSDDYLFWPDKASAHYAKKLWTFWEQIISNFWRNTATLQTSRNAVQLKISLDIWLKKCIKMVGEPRIPTSWSIESGFASKILIKILSNVPLRVSANVFEFVDNMDPCLSHTDWILSLI